MIANSILAAGAFVSLVAAIPMAQAPYPKRDVVWETHTEVALTTIPVTVTHWLEPGETAPADATVGKQHYGHMGHGHGQGGHGKPPTQPEYTEPETTESAAPVAPAYSSPESAPEMPAPSSYEQPTTQQAPPPAPTTTQAPPAPEPTTQQTPPPAYTPEPQPSPQPEPSQPSGGSGSGSGEEYSGDITHYDVGLGSCGQTHSDSEAVVAIPEGMMNNPANPNLNPLCGQTITISYGGQEHTAEIVDTCGGCYETSIDLSPTLFKAVAPNGDGRVSDVKWWFNGD